jgi:glutathione S-transferase
MDVPYHLEEVSLYGPGGKPDWFWDLNPKGEVPILVLEQKQQQQQQQYVGNDNHKKMNSNVTVLLDSDVILDEMGSVVVGRGVGGDKNHIKSTTGGGQLLTCPSYDSSPDKEDIVRKITSFRRTIKDFLPIGKRAVLGGSSKEKLMMWSKLQELDSQIVGPYVVGEDLTIADCAGFPFLWRIEQEYGRGCWTENGCVGIQQWLMECQQLPAFQNGIHRSWWWWW